MGATRPSVTRLMQMHEAIARSGYPSLERLALVCNVNERTVKRDLKELRDMGAVLKFSRARGGYHYAKPFSPCRLPVTDDELAALCMLHAAVGAFHNTHLETPMANALAQLEAQLPDTVMFGAEAREHLACLDMPQPAQTEERCRDFKLLLEAATQHHTVDINYDSMSSRQRRRRKLDPYLLFLQNGAWYVHGHCHVHNENRDFALHRILEVRPTSGAFDAPDLEAVRERIRKRFAGVDGAPAHVKVRFTGEAARRIEEREWHPSQKLMKDGNAVILTMDVTGLAGLVPWLLGYGKDAEVLEPTDLRAEVKARVRDAAHALGLL